MDGEWFCDVCLQPVTDELYVNMKGDRGHPQCVSPIAPLEHMPLMTLEEFDVLISALELAARIRPVTGNHGLTMSLLTAALEARNRIASREGLTLRESAAWRTDPGGP